jgi:hypothetical protein
MSNILGKHIQILINNLKILKILFINYIFLTMYDIELNDIINIIIDDIIALYNKIILKNMNYKNFFESIRIYFNKLMVIIYYSINNIVSNNKFMLINSSFKKEFINIYLNNNEINNDEIKNISLYNIDKLFDSFIYILDDFCKLIN